jgi:hypothetical protein
MSNIKQREYYKIFSGPNQERNDEKISLGYEASTTEITLHKDQTTFFHIPIFAKTENIQNSTLVGAGAISGPIPAAADRIYKKLAGYEDTTPWGKTEQKQDGTWLCSWLYAVSSESPQWLDRYYNPGSLSYDDALKQGINILTTYKNNDPLYYDTPSTLTLESGVWYQYFHQGEKTAAEFVKTFADTDSKRLRLDIDDWSAEPLDKSIYQNRAFITNFKPEWVKTENNPGYLDRNFLSFKNNDFIDCNVVYDSDYNLTNEFTLAVWAKSDNWSESPSTQLVGNLNRGGFSLFFDNLKYYPFFVVTETTYGHFFMFNQEGRVYNEKNSQILIGQPVNFVNTHINSEGHLIAVETTTSRIYEYNHLGEVIAVCRDFNNNLVFMNGEPKLSIIDKDNNTLVITTSGTYTFNSDLILTTYLSSLPYQMDEQICFSYTGELVRQPNCLDIKYDAFNTKWHIDTNKKLYFNNQYLPLEKNSTNLHVDPNNNIWILTDTDTVYIINSQTKQIIKEVVIGITDTAPFETKNISFVYTYIRNTQQKEWYALICHSSEKTLYQVTLDGNVKQTIFLPQQLNTLDLETARQDKDFLTFLFKGDFTGYEWKRIFHNVLYNNNNQIQFKIAANPPSTYNLNTIYKISVPVNYLTNNDWHLIVATYKNRQLNLYINNYLRDSITTGLEIDINYIYRNNLSIGCPTGKSENLNKEINSQALIWDGYIDTVRIYDYAIDPPFIQYLLKEKIEGDDINWNIITAPLQYIESTERFFKHRPPGHKSNFFNIKINQSNITNPQIQEIIENNIRAAVAEIAPVNTELLNIEWR